VKRDDESVDLKVELDRYNAMEGLGFGRPERPAPTRPKGSGYLGAQIEDSKEGVKIMDVRPDGPADRSGLQVGDVILSINDRRIATREEALQRVWQRKPGARIRLLIKRGAEELQIEATLGVNPDDE
jgi:S1-C subfamily serine protease